MDIAINLNLWLAFVAASALLAIIPGPIVTLVVANSLSQGPRAGAANVMGTIIGNLILFTIGGLGMAWVLTVLSNWFDLLRLAGALYLVYLGLKSWFAKGEGLEDQQAAKPGKSLFFQGMVVAITNPKTIIFFAAFFLAAGKDLNFKDLPEDFKSLAIFSYFAATFFFAPLPMKAPTLPVSTGSPSMPHAVSLATMKITS